MRISLTVLLVLLAASASAQSRRSGQTNASGGELLPEQAAYDVTHYDLRLRVDPTRKEIHGTLIMTAELVQPSARIILDLEDVLKIQAVTLNGEATRYEHVGGQIRIDIDGVATGAEFRVAVSYGGTPREAKRPPWDGGFTWEQTADGSPWIATSCQGEGADIWWPCKDHPSDEPDSMDLHISVPAPLVVASNGRLVSVLESAAGMRTYNWHVSTPINNYGVALNIAPYETITTRYESVAGDEFEITYWVLPENREKGEVLFEEMLEHMRFFEDVCGPYPFRADKWGVAETPHLGMEHQSITAYGNQYRVDPNFDYDWLLHHEFAHEWWANLVTALDWNDFWIHEGIGTYMQALYLERKFGPEAYLKKLQSDLKRVKNQGTVAPRGARTTQEMYFSSNRDDAPDIDVYMKGSWICHSLRWLVGDEAFFETLRRWAYPDPKLEATTDGSACRFATTDELLAIAEEHTGMELDWFFELYLRQPHLPQLKVKKTGGTLLLEWETPDDMPFPMPVEVDLDGEFVRVPMDHGKGKLKVGRKPYEIDPRMRVLMQR